MSYTRKRRRSQAFPSEDDEVVEVKGAEEEEAEAEAEEEEEEEDESRSAKEREIWENFREEHFEAVEQLPLSLHRQFTLMRELDEQAHKYNEDLLPSLKKYFSLRLSSGNVSREDANGAPPVEFANALVPSTPVESKVFPLNPTVTMHAISRNTPETPDLRRMAIATPLAREYHSTVATPRTPTPTTIPPDLIRRPQSTRQLLSHVARLSEELLRASEEKVNLAQAAYESVNRHIRLLDQAIKEQDVSASGVKHGSHPLPILLPELVVPRWARPSRATLSPAPSSGGDGDPDTQNEDGALNIGTMASNRGGQQPARPQKRKGKKGRPSRIENEPSEEPIDPHRRTTRSLKLTFPGANIPDEPRYCYCDQVSFGEMIACDGKKCEREWFHLACAGLTEPPKKKSKWYCVDCSEKMVKGRR